MRGQLLLIIFLVSMASSAQPPSLHVEVRALCAQSEAVRNDSVLQALALANDALSIADKGGWAEGRAMALCRIGACYDKVRRWNEALSFFHQSAFEARKAGNDTLLLQTVFDIAETHNKLRHRDSSLYYKMQALALARKIRVAAMEVQLLNIIAGLYYDEAATERAIYWWRLCLDKLEGKRPNAEAMVRNNLAEAFLRNNVRDSALHHLRIGLPLVQATRDRGTESYLHLTLANFYAGHHQDSALHYAMRALAMARQGNDQGIAEHALKLLSELFSNNGRQSDGLYYYKSYIARRDSSIHAVQTAEEAWQVLRFDFDRAVADLHTKQDLFESRQRRANRALWLVAGVLVLVTLFSAGLGLLLRQNRRRARVIQQQARVLLDQTNQLQALVGEKELLLREVHHRVKNNLQVISGLLQLQSTRSSEATVKAALDDTQNRVLSIAFIHHNLYQAGGLNSVEMGTFLKELIEHLESVFDNPLVAVTLDIPALDLDIDTAVPLGLVINELLTNSFKYAFPGIEDGSIFIRILNPEPGHYVLHYEDSGPGLPPGVDPVKARSLGLRLIHQLARQLDGHVAWIGRPQNQVRFTFKDAATRNKENELPI
ncbi:MAG: sensor histidine kinase [Chitinophagaceae bacterium]|nr:MAG: sensor histidine kinase [Chitinophagaceae bacterium]